MTSRRRHSYTRGERNQRRREEERDNRQIRNVRNYRPTGLSVNRNDIPNSDVARRRPRRPNMPRLPGMMASDVRKPSGRPGTISQFRNNTIQSRNYPNVRKRKRA